VEQSEYPGLDIPPGVDDNYRSLVIPYGESAAGVTAERQAEDENAQTVSRRAPCRECERGAFPSRLLCNIDRENDSSGTSRLFRI